jgi:hypothetical protein
MPRRREYAMMMIIISDAIMDGFRTNMRWSIMRTGRPPTDMVMTTITTIIRHALA